MLVLSSIADGEKALTDDDRPPAGSVPMTGIFKNYNTIEEFRATEPKKELFNSATDMVSSVTFGCW